MLLEDIQKSIVDMKEIQQLEQASKDSKKQDNIDKLYSLAVFENHRIINSLDEARRHLKFSPSSDLVKQIKRMLSVLHSCIDTGLVQENQAKGLSSSIKAIKDTISGEWKIFYGEIADKRIRTLNTVQSITPDRIKTGYVINKIKNGSTIDYGDSRNLKMLSDGIKEADAILESLELTDEILCFLDKVGEERATLLDLTDSVKEWIYGEKLVMKFTILFKT